MEVIVSGGGTAGHIMPALSVGRELQNRGNIVFFIGNKNSMEQNLCDDLQFLAINTQKIYRELTFKHFFFPFKLGYSFFKSLIFFLKIKPEVFFGSGGFVCAAPAMAAIFYQKIVCKRIKIYFHEQNSYPGMVTKYLGKYAQCVFLGNKRAASFFSTNLFVGNPIQDYNVKRGENILIVGGSQGSQFLNELISKSLPLLLQTNKKIDWQVGEKNLGKYEEYKSKKVNIFGFSSNMPEIYNRSGLVICRSGALTLGELQARGLPAVLVPLSISAANHQYKNALSYVEGGAGIVLEEKLCSSKKLGEAILEILENYDDYKKRAEKKKSYQQTSKSICEKILYDLKKSRK